MKFTIQDGKNICSIGLSDVGSYMKFNYPLTVVWYDNLGSVGKYFCVLPYNEEYRTTVRNKVNESLTEDFTQNIEGLYEVLKPLLPIFKNGEYNLNFYSNKEKEFFQYQTSSDNFSKNHFFELEVVFAEKTTDISNTEIVIGQHKSFLKENMISRKYYPSNLLEYSTDGIYTGWQSFFATQPIDNIDQSRVKYFEEKISDGERPFAIIFNARLPTEDFESSYFILDGHHKLLAYKNLNLYPPMALITYLPNDIESLEFDAEILNEILYPWQIQHILDHWEEKDSYLKQVLKKPSSNLHKIIKNGEYEEYHENGRIKHKAFYINDNVEGSSKHWYENGQLKSEHYYAKGLRMKTWKDYYPSGKIQFIQPFNEQGKYHGIMVSYFENGQKRIEQRLENGIPEDGISYKVWFENGKKEAELSYKNGCMIERKNWSQRGLIINHEIFNEAEKANKITNLGFWEKIKKTFR